MTIMYPAIVIGRNKRMNGPLIFVRSQRYATTTMGASTQESARESGSCSVHAYRSEQPPGRMEELEGGNIDIKITQRSDMILTSM